MLIERALNKESSYEVSLKLDKKFSRGISYSGQIVFFQFLHYTCFSSAICPLQVPGLYGSAWIRYTLLQQSGTTLLLISRWYENRSGTVREVCCTCKHHYPIRNTPKPCFDIWWFQCKWGWSIAWEIGKENNKYGRGNEIILARNSVTGLLSRLRVNTHTPERFLYRIQESDMA